MLLGLADLDSVAKCDSVSFLAAIQLVLGYIVENTFTAT